MSKNVTISTDTQPGTTLLTGRISSIIETARSRVRTLVDTEMVRAYRNWNAASMGIGNLVTVQMA